MRPGLRQNLFPLPLRPDQILTELLLTYKSHPVNTHQQDQLGYRHPGHSSELPSVCITQCPEPSAQPRATLHCVRVDTLSERSSNRTQDQLDGNAHAV